ncbi:MAG: FadR family transcriptional regulator [Desulfomonile tiedjei]|uniref:FadR family transcriptional regulator n=1 Tax=Desulfomonile tiedjei TaxID=2358 RepID=A0A9D6V8W9_9BACT|nr:FadR family transcriptional regulator [Desulfomonile tiedjei]
MFTPTQKGRKVSHYVVEQIRDAILRGEFKPGDRLASERELISQFQVSKASMREALRVLEGMGLIETRKGTGGGIFAAEVNMNTTIHSLTNFLSFKNVSIGDITALRYFLEPRLAQIALSKITEHDIRVLETMTNEEVSAPPTKDQRGIGFHYYIARFSENPLLILIMDFIESLLADLKVKLDPGAEFYEEVGHDHFKIIECFRRKDVNGVKNDMASHVLRVGQYLANLAGTTPFVPLEFQQIGPVGQTVDTEGQLIGSNHEPLLPLPAQKSLEDLGLLLRHVGNGDLYLIRVKSELEAE